MIEFRQRTLQERLLRRLWPPYRRSSDAALYAAISELIDDPLLPCVIENHLVPNGYEAPPAKGSESHR